MVDLVDLMCNFWGSIFNRNKNLTTLTTGAKMKAMKRTDKVTVTISADTLVLLWHYLNGSQACQDAYRKIYSHNMPDKRLSHAYASSDQWKEVSAECQRLFSIRRLDLEEVKFDDETKSISLNDEYSAEILDDTVKVGCQEFTHEAVKKLHKAIKQSKK